MFKYFKPIKVRKSRLLYSIKHPRTERLYILDVYKKITRNKKELFRHNFFYTLGPPENIILRYPLRFILTRFNSLNLLVPIVSEPCYSVSFIYGQIESAPMHIYSLSQLE